MNIFLPTKMTKTKILKIISRSQLNKNIIYKKNTQHYPELAWTLTTNILGLGPGVWSYDPKLWFYHILLCHIINNNKLLSLNYQHIFPAVTLDDFGADFYGARYRLGTASPGRPSHSIFFFRFFFLRFFLNLASLSQI